MAEPGGALADLLRELHRRARLTQQELADRARVSLRTVSDLERGVSTTPQRETVRLLAATSAMDTGGVVGIHAIGGMAGVGKTAFAVHAAHQLAGLGRCALADGDVAQAESLLRQALEIFERIGAAEAADLAAELDAVAS
jgi:transcriptional regulator with XRE-family HTH domain